MESMLMEEKIGLLLNSSLSDFHKQELLFVLCGKKLVCRQGKYVDELPLFLRVISSLGLFAVVSSFKVVPFREGYSEGGLRVRLDDVRIGMQFVYIAKDEQSVYLACYYDLMLDNENLGIILGYPPCCIEYFLLHFSEAKVDLSRESYLPPLNISLRAEGLSLISHFPCSYDCHGSLIIALDALVILEKYWSVRANILKEKLHLS